MGPVEISNWALNLWCCILSFTFVSIIWLIPFIFVLFLLVFLFHYSRKQQSPEFKWDDMFITFVFYFLILIVAHVFLRIWDYLGIPVEYVRDTLSSAPQGGSGGGRCIASWTSVNIWCCSNLIRFEDIRGVIDLIINIIILLTKILILVGTLVMVFFWGYDRYRYAKPAFYSGQANIAFLVAQAIFAGFVIVMFLSFIFYAYKHLLFFDVYEIIKQVLGCLVR